MVRHAVSTAEGRGGVPLFRQTWRPEAGARARALMVHGHGEYSGEENFGALIRALLQRGFAVDAFDLRGHGRSGGKPGVLREWADFAEDLERVRALAERDAAGLPLFLFAHSLGGLIGVDHALNHPAGLRGAAFTGPLLCEPILPGWQRAAGRVMGVLAPDFSIPTGKRPEDNTDVPAEQSRIAADPRFRPCGSARLSENINAAIARVQAAAPGWKLPLLILHGTADKIVPPDGSRQFASVAGAADKHLSLYEGAPHHLLISSVAARAAAELADWMEARA